MQPSTNVLICGAGIAGISAAYHLAVRHGVKDILLVDERAPLSLTSDKSTECYRNWWPGPGVPLAVRRNAPFASRQNLLGRVGISSPPTPAAPFT